MLPSDEIIAMLDPFFFFSIGEAHVFKCVLGFCFWIMHGCTYIIGFCLSPAIKQLVYLSSLLFACFVFASEFSF